MLKTARQALARANGSDGKTGLAANLVHGDGARGSHSSPPVAADSFARTASDDRIEWLIKHQDASLIRLAEVRRVCCA